MAKTIGNPVSWAVASAASAIGHAGAVADSVAAPASAAAPPRVRQIGIDDLRVALRKGLEDLAAFRSDVVFTCVLYPIIGAVLAAFALHGDMVHLIFPALSGFALVGPVAAVGLYEMSRRRERGEPTSWLAYLDVLQSPKFGGVVVLALFHLVIFITWIMAANMIHAATMGSELPPTVAGFAAQVVSTPAGRAMIVLGMATGFLFAAVVLATSLVSFPLLLDRDVGLAVAVVTSVRVALTNPVPVAAWGLVVAGLLALGALPALIGLIFVLPLLGHATWHLYRAAVE